MEEQKNNSKEVKINGKQNDNGNSQEKLSYEKLQEIANSLWNENRQMRQQLLSIDRIDYLLKVISVANSCKNYYFDIDFVQKCIDEVQKAMTLPENSQSTEDNKES